MSFPSSKLTWEATKKKKRKRKKQKNYPKAFYPLTRRSTPKKGKENPTFLSKQAKADAHPLFFSSLLFFKKPNFSHLLQAKHPFFLFLKRKIASYIILALHPHGYTTIWSSILPLEKS